MCQLCPLAGAPDPCFDIFAMDDDDDNNQLFKALRWLMKRYQK
jgi:hypothetical protein